MKTGEQTDWYVLLFGMVMAALATLGLCMIIALPFI